MFNFTYPLNNHTSKLIYTTLIYYPTFALSLYAFGPLPTVLFSLSISPFLIRNIERDD